MMEIELRQKPQKRRKRKTCFDCAHSSAFDSEIEKVIPKHAYCRRYRIIVLAGHARICSLFEPFHAPPSFKSGGKRFRRW